MMHGKPSDFTWVTLDWPLRWALVETTCPTCKAKPDQWCRTRSGYHARTHRARLQCGEAAGIEAVKRTFAKAGLP